MKVEDLMTKPAILCRLEQNLGEVVEILWSNRCGSLPVVDNDGNVVSVITDRDIAIALGTRTSLAGEVRVADVALPRVFTCLASDRAFDALNTMVTQNVRRLPVVDHTNKLVGLLSIDDFIRVAAYQNPVHGKLHDTVMQAAAAISDSRLPNNDHSPAELLERHV